MYMISLLLDELVRRAEVLARVPRVGHHPIELVGQGAEGRGALGPGGRVLAQSEVLDHEGGAEAALVVVGGGHVGHDAGDGVVRVHGPAPARGRAQDGGHKLGVKAKTEKNGKNLQQQK